MFICEQYFANLAIETLNGTKLYIGYLISSNYLKKGMLHVNKGFIAETLSYIKQSLYLKLFYIYIAMLYLLLSNKSLIEKKKQFVFFYFVTFQYNSVHARRYNVP